MRTSSDEDDPRLPADLPVVRLRQAPFRGALEASAHTLAYDARIDGDVALPVDLIRSIGAATLVVDGEVSPPIMRKAAEALVHTLPDARRWTLANQDHDLAPDALGPVLIEFLA